MATSRAEAATPSRELMRTDVAAPGDRAARNRGHNRGQLAPLFSVIIEGDGGYLPRNEPGQQGRLYQVASPKALENGTALREAELRKGPWTSSTDRARCRQDHGALAGSHAHWPSAWHRASVPGSLRRGKRATERLGVLTREIAAVQGNPPRDINDVEPRPGYKGQGERAGVRGTLWCTGGPKAHDTSLEAGIRGWLGHAEEPKVGGDLAPMVGLVFHDAGEKAGRGPPHSQAGVLVDPREFLHGE